MKNIFKYIMTFLLLISSTLPSLFFVSKKDANIQNTVKSNNKIDLNHDNTFFEWQLMFGYFLYRIIDNDSKKILDVFENELNVNKTSIYNEALGREHTDSIYPEFFKYNFLMQSFFNFDSYALEKSSENFSELFSWWINDFGKENKYKYWVIINFWFVYIVPNLFKNHNKIIFDDEQGLGNKKNIPKFDRTYTYVDEAIESNKNQVPELILKNRSLNKGNEKIFIRAYTPFFESSNRIENNSYFNNIIGASLESIGSFNLEYSSDEYLDNFKNFSILDSVWSEDYTFLNFNPLQKFQNEINNSLFEEVHLEEDNAPNLVDTFEILKKWDEEREYKEASISEALNHISNLQNWKLWNKYKNNNSALELIEVEDHKYKKLGYSLSYISYCISLIPGLKIDNDNFLKLLKRINISQTSRGNLQGEYVSSISTIWVYIINLNLNTQITNNPYYLASLNGMESTFIHELGHFLNDIFKNPIDILNLKIDNNNSVDNDNKDIEKFGVYGTDNDENNDFDFDLFEKEKKKIKKIKIKDLSIKTSFDNSSYLNRDNLYQKIYEEILKNASDLNEKTILFDKADIYALFSIYYKENDNYKLINDKFFSDNKWYENEYDLFAKIPEEFSWIFTKDVIKIHVDNKESYKNIFNLDDVNIDGIPNASLNFNKSYNYEMISNELKYNFIYYLNKIKSLNANEKDIELEIYIDNKHTILLKNDLSNLDTGFGNLYYKVKAKEDSNNLVGSTVSSQNYTYNLDQSKSKFNIYIYVVIGIIASILLIILFKKILKRNKL